MKILHIVASFALASILLLPICSRATDLGDPAPALTIEKWVKGGPVDLQAGKGQNVYVVEFWATWCPPCRASIPHLSELQQEFKDQKVVIIGISDEPVSKVEPFVKKMGEKMEYVVAVDDARQTFKNYMSAFGVNGIPHAFVVEKSGNLVWHGHPMAGLDNILKQVLAGTFDIGAAKRQAGAEKIMREYFSIVTAGKSTADAAEMGRQFLADAKDNPSMLNEFSWAILTHPRIKDRDLALATEVAKLAYDATDGKDAAIVDTYARALFDTGKHSEAIAMQEHAIKVCKDTELRAGLEDTLDRYRLEASK